MTPALKEIIRIIRSNKTNPFKKAIDEFREIMESNYLTPLDRLYKLQTLPLTDQIEKSKDFSHKFGPLDRDDKHTLYKYVII